MSFEAEGFSYRVMQSMTREYQTEIATMMRSPWPAGFKKCFKEEMGPYEKSNTKRYLDESAEALVSADIGTIGWFAVKVFEKYFAFVDKSDLKGVWLMVREAIDKAQKEDVKK